MAEDDERDGGHGEHTRRNDKCLYELLAPHEAEPNRS